MKSLKGKKNQWRNSIPLIIKNRWVSGPLLKGRETPRDRWKGMQLVMSSSSRRNHINPDQEKPEKDAGNSTMNCQGGKEGAFDRRNEALTVVRSGTFKKLPNWRNAENKRRLER